MFSAPAFDNFMVFFRFHVCNFSTRYTLHQQVAVREDFHTKRGLKLAVMGFSDLTASVTPLPSRIGLNFSLPVLTKSRWASH